MAGFSIPDTALTMPRAGKPVKAFEIGAGVGLKLVLGR
jgi:hypothetical protein